MPLPESSLVDAVVDYLTATPPAALGSGVTVRREGDTAGVDSPRLIVGATTATDGHPFSLRCDVTVTLHTQVDDTTTADAEAWISAVKDTLDSAAFRASIQETLYDSSVMLRKFLPVTSNLDPVTGPRLRTHSLTYLALLQTNTPA